MLIVPVFDVPLAQYGVGIVVFCTYDCPLAVPHAGVSLDVHDAFVPPFAPRHVHVHVPFAPALLAGVDPS